MRPGFAIVAICLLLAKIHNSTAKAEPSSSFLLIETEDSDKEEVRRVKVKGEEEKMDYTDSREPEGENKKSKKENTEKKKTAGLKGVEKTEDQLPAKMRKKAIATRGAGKVNRWYWWLVDHPTQLICIWIFIGPR